MIISKEQAREQGTSPGMLRVIANSIERLGRGWLSAIPECKEDHQVRSCKDNANVDFSNARRLRTLAKEIEKENRK